MSREEQFDFYWKEIFDGLAYNPIEFNVYRFDQSMSLPSKFNKLYEMFKQLALNNQQVMDYLKEFMETFDFKLETTIKDILIVWLNEGLLADVVREAINDEVVEARTDYLDHTYLNLKERLDLEREEVILARGGEANLKVRLDKENQEVTAQLAQTEQDLTAKLHQKTNRTESFVNVSEFGAVGDYYLPDGRVNPTPTDDTQAIKNTLNAHKRVEFSDKAYYVTDTLILNGHVLKGNFIGDTFSNKTKIVFNNLPLDATTALRVESSSQIDNILFEHAPWTENTHALNGLDYVNRKLIANNCGFNAFPGHGVMLHRLQDFPDKAPYGTTFNNCNFDYNKKHGLFIANGANAVFVNNPQARWNGTDLYKQSPTQENVYDGINYNGKVSTLLPGFNFEPSGCVLIGGDISYNSRFGVNYEYANDNIMVGGYLEMNLSNDIAVGNSYGITIVNPMALSREPTLTTTATDSNTPARNIAHYPNRIVVRGKDLGTGLKNAQGKYYKMFTPTDLVGGPFISTDPTERDIILDSKWNGTGSGQSFLKLTDRVHLATKNAVFGVESPKIDKGIWFYPSADAEGSIIFAAVNGMTVDDKWTTFYSVKGAYPSGTKTGLTIPGHSTTMRSINAGGTINTSGADYAEYMYKENPTDVIEKGDICGISANGKITLEYEKAIAFVVKSTNPSFVGGDTWSEKISGEVDSPNYAELLETERQKVDRIAFSGICPVNVLGLEIGDYIIPVNNNGLISGIGKKNPTFEEYQKSVGKVISFEDGKPIIIVKVV